MRIPLHLIGMFGRPFPFAQNRRHEIRRGPFLLRDFRRHPIGVGVGRIVHAGTVVVPRGSHGRGGVAGDFFGGLEEVGDHFGVDESGVEGEEEGEEGGEVDGEVGGDEGVAVFLEEGF